MTLMPQGISPGLEQRQVPTIVGQSQQAEEMRNFVLEAAASKHHVLLLGELGTGKDQAARAIHKHSSRFSGRFVTVNCAAIPETLFEAELFGHSRGAYTGAMRDTKGLFGTAQDGTLFLNEIAEISPTMQAKLLEVVEGHTYRRVGEDNEKVSNARIIAATNVRDPVAQGKMRPDLYYRLNVLTHTVPPLRERREDIPALVQHFLEQECTKKEIAPETWPILMRYSWPGNVRELQNTIVRAVIHSNGDGRIGPEYVEPYLMGRAQNETNNQLVFPAVLPTVDNLEQELLKEALRRCKGRPSKASRLIGLTPRTINYRIRKFGLEGFSDTES